MSDHLRGYVLDCGFLVFGDGMIRPDNVQAVKIERNEYGRPTAYVWFHGNTSAPTADNGHDYDFAPLSPEQERNYVSMARDRVMGDFVNGLMPPDDGAYDPARDSVPAEASTGCEPKMYSCRSECEDVTLVPGYKPKFLVDTKEIDRLRCVYRGHLMGAAGSLGWHGPSIDDEMRRLCRYSCLDWEQLKEIFDGERRTLGPLIHQALAPEANMGREPRRLGPWIVGNLDPGDTVEEIADGQIRITTRTGRAFSVAYYSEDQ
jgi:hypothetical protein